MLPRSARACASLATVLTLAFATSACTASENVFARESDYLTYSSVEELVEASAVMISGTFVSDRRAVLEPNVVDSADPIVNPQAGINETDDPADAGVPVTISQIRVTEVLLGDVAAGDIVEVTQIGGEADGAVYSDTALPLLSRAKNATLVLALAAFEDGTLAPLNPSQAVFVLSDDGALTPLGDAHPGTSFTDLTLDSLREHTLKR